MPAKKSIKSTAQHSYQILVNRQLTYQFKVRAESAAKACEKLQRQLDAEDTLQEPSSSKPLFYRWSDPKEPREEWAMMRTTPVDGGDFLLLQIWDGDKLVAMGEGTIGNDIVQVMRKLVDPKVKKTKTKKSTK